LEIFCIDLITEIPKTRAKFLEDFCPTATGSVFVFILCFFQFETVHFRGFLDTVSALCDIAA